MWVKVGLDFDLFQPTWVFSQVPVLIFYFFLYLNFCLARKFSQRHCRNILRFSLSDVSFSKVVVFVMLELTLVY